MRLRFDQPIGAVIRAMASSIENEGEAKAEVLREAARLIDRQWPDARVVLTGIHPHAIDPIVSEVAEMTQVLDHVACGVQALEERLAIVHRQLQRRTEDR